VDQRIDAVQGTGEVTLDEIVDGRYLDLAFVNLGEAFLILRESRGADDAIKDSWLRIEYQRGMRYYSPSNAVTLFD
jgi:hypothetical protein